MVQHLTAEEIIQYISDAKKSTPIKVYLMVILKASHIQKVLKYLVQNNLK